MGGALSGGLAAVESVINEDDLGDATANVMSNALRGAISSGIGTTVTEGTYFALATAPIPVAAKAAIGIGIGLGVGSLASGIAGEFCEGVGDIAGTVAEGVCDVAGEVLETFVDYTYDAMETTIDLTVGAADLINDILG